MIKAKQIDLYIQVLLIAGSVLYCLVLDSSFLFNTYFLVGGWQLLSCLFHTIYKHHYFQCCSRKYYLRTLLWVFISGIAAIPVWLFFGFGLLIISPAMAVWYASICYTENKMLDYKSLIHLK